MKQIRHINFLNLPLAFVFCFALTNCHFDLAEKNPDTETNTVKTEPSSSRLEKLFGELNQIASSAESSDRAIGSWINDAKNVLDIKPEDKSDDPLIDSINEKTQKLTGGGEKKSIYATAQTVADYVGTVAGYLNYLGVPYAGTVKSIAKGGTSIKDNLDALRNFDPKKQLSTAYTYANDYLSYLKEKIVGLSEEQKAELIAKLETLTKNILSANKNSREIAAQNLALAKIIDEQKSEQKIESFFIIQYAQSRFTKQLADMTLIIAMTNQMKAIGDAITPRLEHVKTEEPVSAAVDKFLEALTYLKDFDDIRAQVSSSIDKLGI